MTQPELGYVSFAQLKEFATRESYSPEEARATWILLGSIARAHASGKEIFTEHEEIEGPLLDADFVNELFNGDAYDELGVIEFDILSLYMTERDAFLRGSPQDTL